MNVSFGQRYYFKHWYFINYTCFHFLNAIRFNFLCVWIWHITSTTSNNKFQMAGRSGRRGFDQVGNVYFFGIGPRKIQHLMSSDLSEISGNFPISTALVLRLFLFCNRSSDRQLALNMVRWVISKHRDISLSYTCEVFKGWSCKLTCNTL